MTKRSAKHASPLKAVSRNQADSMNIWRRNVMRSITDPLFVELLFDCLPDVVFSVKNRNGQYVSISDSCVARCGLTDRSQAIGRTAHELFPKHMADRYVAQDERLFRTGKPIFDNLDLTLYSNKQPGWCITTKYPIKNSSGELVALACISKDLIEPGRHNLIDEPFSKVIDHIQDNFAQPLRIPDLAAMAGLSTGQFDRRMKAIFHISAVQYLIKTRIHHASMALANDDRPIADIALESGFCDQSALSRQFKQLTGLTPREYRAMMQSPES